MDCNVEVDYTGKCMTSVREQTYLGVILSEDGSMDCELENRIGAALSAAGAVKSRVLREENYIQCKDAVVINRHVQ